MMEGLPCTEHDAPRSAVPARPEQSAAIREQLERIVLSPAFCNGKRYPSFLRYIVEETLEGRASDLKERSLGIAVFERDPDYDTSADHIVRSAAAEIRKRLAQYYLQPNHHSELRIEVPIGSYVPQFRFPPIGEPPAWQPADAVVPLPLPVRPAGRLLGWDRLSPRAALVALTALGLAAAALWIFLPRETTLDRFWRPVIAGSTPVLICIADDARLQATATSATDPSSSPPDIGDVRAMTHQVVHMEDVVLLARAVGAITALNGRYRVLTSASAVYEDLQEGPSVLIGGRNPWIGRALESAPLRFLPPAAGGFPSIVDSRDPKASWIPVLSPGATSARGYGRVTVDHALIARFRDPRTNRMVVTAVGGLGFGAIAAGLFLTDESVMRQLEAVAPRGWKNRNLEVVLAVDVVQGVTGRPRIVASRFW
jgi:hypothetical protein